MSQKKMKVGISTKKEVLFELMTSKYKKIVKLPKLKKKESEFVK